MRRLSIDGDVGSRNATLKASTSRSISPFPSEIVAKKQKRQFTSPDGTPWRVDVTSPGSSNAMVVFRHPNARTTELDRYAWFISRGAEATDVTARLNKGRVLESLADADLQRLFRRSMPVTTSRRPPDVAPDRSGVG
jgi:hypothetical protein